MAGRVLVVGDHAASRGFLLLALSDEGYEVLAAPDGRVALAFAAEHAPNLVLLDYNMSGSDGRCWGRGRRWSS